MAKSEIKKTKKAAPKKDTARDLAKMIAQAAYDAKAEDLIVLDLRELQAFSDYFVIATGRSDRHVQSIGERIEYDLKKEKHLPISNEGHEKGHWVLLDYGNVVAHIFYAEAREFYALEKLWSDAPQVHFRLK